MGVTGLWTVVQPCARPVKLETLNRKRLAVDASIWIYQFLKAVRDKEGNALRNAHLVGFFRRICKLLYFGIKPVFVFDGGAPALKRQTIAARKKRREGRREDSVRTAGKLLAVQMQRLAEEEEAKRKAPRRPQQEEEEVPDNAGYVEEIFMTEKEKRQNRKFRKKDTYHLPDLDVSLEQMGAPDDPRIMSQEELEEYARQFHSGEEINLYDFSKIDFDSPFFQSLPATDRYNILNAARLRSRLRMGYSKEQLDSMFPDRMAFSKFQIERVKERNDLTQRLMNINGMNGPDAMHGFKSGQRIAGERGKEYVLVKNPDVEGGWALGVVGNKNAGARDKPIDVDQYGQQEIFPENKDEEDDEDAFEDVPIEGLNRLPKLPILQKGVFDESIQRQMQEIAEKRKAVYEARREAAEKSSRNYQDHDDSLFVQGATGATGAPGSTQPISREQEVDGLFEGDWDSEDEDLRRAIEMSLESAKDEDVLEDALPSKDVSSQLQPKPQEAIPAPDSDGDDMDFAAALAKSKRPFRGPKPKSMAPNIGAEHAFSGPLPFEPLKTTRPKGEKPQEADLDEDAGGFERESDTKQEEKREKKKAAPLPPWFAGEEGLEKEFINDDVGEESVEKYRDAVMTPHHTCLREHRSPDVIDVDKIPDSKEVIDLEADEGAEAKPEKQPSKQPPSRMGEIAGDIRMDPPVHSVSDEKPEDRTEIPVSTTKDVPEDEQVYEWEATDDEGGGTVSKTAVEEDAVRGDSAVQEEKSPSPEFEDVQISVATEPATNAENNIPPQSESAVPPAVDQEDMFVDDEAEYSDPEDEELMQQLAAEAEEHARFASALNNKTPAENAFDYEQELKQLRSQQKRDRRDADEVSQIMITECQQLLRLFGLPYITAPMEAEAQCAELVSLGLVDGIVTDDSDIFLFGGTRVYKNMFNQSKYVECYLANDLEKEYALDRKKLISFAHLLGSDYTDGIPGVGPVTALEIITEFSSLEEFRDWWTQVQMGVDIPNDPHAGFRKKFKKNASKLFLPPSFPDPRIDKAYLEPEVDSDPSPFQWGVPDLNGLRSFLMSTVGWSQERTDEVLVPIIRDMNRREQEGTQSNITRFVSGGQGAGAFAPRVRSEGSSRMEKAFSRLRAEAETRKRASQAASEPEAADEDDQQDSGSSKKRRKRATRKGH
ncbi:hypothetical protein VTN77DRAFT_4485 [Rasamsonia byssochlamydoides]|uniref:uncharacterized protein n=1 Tax=Rasamsonia byssochlamydoides TaxID=89139 RepID=UPI003742E54C